MWIQAQETIKRILLGLAVLLVVLVAVVLVRTLGYSSRQIAAEAPTAYEIEETAAVQRLAGALRFATVSAEDPAQRDETAFADFRAYLADVFPRAHSALRREEVGNGSLLYTRPGSDPRRATIHGAVEHVPVADYPRAVRFYAQLVENSDPGSLATEPCPACVLCR